VGSVTGWGALGGALQVLQRLVWRGVGAQEDLSKPFELRLEGWGVFEVRFIAARCTPDRLAKPLCC
jgi:hypothetical protein